MWAQLWALFVMGGFEFFWDFFSILYINGSYLKQKSPQKITDPSLAILSLAANNQKLKRSLEQIHKIFIVDNPSVQFIDILHKIIDIHIIYGGVILEEGKFEDIGDMGCVKLPFVFLGYRVEGVTCDCFHFLLVLDVLVHGIED